MKARGPKTTMKSLAAAIALLSLAVAAPAAAQIATNSKAPIDITSDELDTQNNTCVSVWQGNVEALQDTSRLRTDQLKMFMETKAKPGSNNGAGGSAGSSCGNITRMEAHGSVFYVTPQQRVHGDEAIYEAEPDTITVIGDVVAVNGQNVLRGERMVINQKTGQGQMVTDVKGRNKPGRVRGVFYPQQSQNSTSAPGTTTPAAPQKR